MPDAKQTGALASKTGTAVAIRERTVVEVIAEKVRKLMASHQIDLPADYSAENALKSAWLALQEIKDKDGNLALAVCTPASVQNALLDMVIQGLTVAKKQLYLIPYGKVLTCQRSYFGDMALARRVDPGIGDFGYQVVYKGDKLAYKIERGRRVVTNHEQELENINKADIVAAYCTIYDNDGRPVESTIMTMAEIAQAWKQSKMNPVQDGKVKSDSTHGKFTADMCLRTVIRKACKVPINSSSDCALLSESIRRQDAAAADGALDAEASASANSTVIDIAPEPAPAQLAEAPAPEVEPDVPENQDSDPPTTATAATKPKAVVRGQALPGF